MKLHYNRFVADPQHTLHQIKDFLNEKDINVNVFHDGKIEPKVDHTVSGNPVRFKTGKIRIRMDDEWKTKMKREDRLLVSLLSYPLMKRYQDIE